MQSKHCTPLERVATARSAVASALGEVRSASTDSPTRRLEHLQRMNDWLERAIVALDARTTASA